MKTAIIYSTKHGTTDKVARKIKEMLPADEVELIDLAQKGKVEFNTYNRLIIGSPIYAGSIHPLTKKFVKQNMVELLQKELGIFVCCMFFEKASEQIEKSFPVVLRQHAKSIKHLGGAFQFEKMNFTERFLVRKITGVTTSISKIDHEGITEFIDEMNN